MLTRHYCWGLFKFMDEIWKDIKGYEGYYQVSNLSRVKSLERDVPYKNTTIHRKEHIMSSIINRYGYVKVLLSKNSISKLTSLHRIVAIAWIPNNNNKRTVNHKNGIKSDNRIENLEWATDLEQVIHAEQNGLANHIRKLSDKDVIDIYNSQDMLQSLSNKYAVRVETVRRIKTGAKYSNLTGAIYTRKRTSLKREQVIEIFKSDKNATELAIIYKVSDRQIHSIKSGECWSEITNSIYS